MTQDKKPREFWLNKYTCEFHIGKLSDDDIHVIEYTAYESLLSIIKRQQVALELYAKAYLYQSGGMAGNNPLILDDYGTVSRATLAATKEELKKLGLGDV